MGGGLMQLVAYGAQDIYLTGNPQITFWKVVYRRCTNFAIESVEQTFMGNATPGSRATATISRNGDLVSNCVLEVNITARSGLDDANALQQTKLEKEYGRLSRRATSSPGFDSVLSLKPVIQFHQTLYDPFHGQRWNGFPYHFPNQLLRKSLLLPHLP